MPGPIKWHPEIDTGLHTFMVLEQAAKISPSAEMRFAALLHDLGKAVTNPAKWPSHHGHELLGVPIVKQLCERLKVPNEYKELSLLVCEFHSHVHHAFELKPATIIKVFNRCDAWRKPERFAMILEISEADQRGRLGFENLPYPQHEFMSQCFKQAMNVDVQQVIADGFCGAAIRQELDKRRIRIIAQHKKELAK